MTQNEYNEETSAAHGVVQFGTTAVLNSDALNFKLIKFHSDAVITTIYVDGLLVNVDEHYHLEGAGSTYPAGSIIKPRVDLGHRIITGVDLASGTAEGVLSDKKKA